MTDKAKLKKIVRDDAVKGWSVVTSEQADWVASIGVPVRNSKGATIAALGMGWMAGTVPDQIMIDKLLPQMQDAARTIEENIKQRR